MLSEPAVANLSCAECSQFIYEPAKNWAPLLRHDQTKYPRPSRVPPPCNLCPKKSPREAWLYELSAKNRRALRHYFECRAMAFNGMTEAERRDPIVRRNFGIIDAAIREHDRGQSTRDAMLVMQAAFSELKQGFKK